MIRTLFLSVGVVVSMPLCAWLLYQGAWHNWMPALSFLGSAVALATLCFSVIAGPKVFEKIGKPKELTLMQVSSYGHFARAVSIFLFAGAVFSMMAFVVVGVGWPDCFPIGNKGPIIIVCTQVVAWLFSAMCLSFFAYLAERAVKDYVLIRLTSR